jgi:hypothetical protein
MSSCSQIFSEEALLKVQEMAQSLSELRDLQRRVRQAEARAPARRQQKIKSSTTKTGFDRSNQRRAVR